MLPIVKDSEPISSALDPASPRSPGVAAAEDSSNRPQPVAMEIPVNVNGARALEDSEKREPFSESTKTVLVFGNGAVIRLNCPVLPGQLLFLTNEKTRKEVVCQVVKSKNYRNASGYVELEFTEPVVGFWGLRFPGDRIGQQAGATSIPAPARTGSSPATATGATVEPKLTAAPLRPSGTSPLTPAPRTPESSITSSLRGTSVDLGGPRANSPAQVSSRDAASSLSNPHSSLKVSSVPGGESAGLSASQPGASEGRAAEPLKQNDALVHEQLAAALFAGQESAKVSTAAPAADVAGLEITDSTQQRANAEARETPARFSTPAIKSALDADEVKIPSWLEPLARNAAAAQQETKEFSNSEDSADSHAIVEPLAASVEISSFPGPALGGVLLGEDAANESKTSSNKGVLLGAVAAGLLIAAGAAWFFLRPANTQGTAAAYHPPVSETAGGKTPVQTTQVSEPQTAPRAQIALPQITPAAAPPISSHMVESAETAPRNGAVKTASMAAISAPSRAQIAVPEKKPSLGEIHLATPSVARRAASNANAEGGPALTITGADLTAAGDALGAGLVTAENKQPVAPPTPLAIGGDVHTARLLSSTPPVYPTLARSQHISGDVRIDALIDASGRVSSMKVVSGPALLHQAAMEALRQWKYQAATLDGKAVPMHLVVTIQFRLQ